MFEALKKVTKGVEVFYTTTGEAMLTIPCNNPEKHFENWRLESDNAKAFLRSRYLRNFEKPLPDTKLKEFLYSISALTTMSGENSKEKVYRRIAGDAADIYVDLCNPNWQCIKITPEGWEKVNDVPVKFLRSGSMLPFIEPLKGGDIKKLRPFINTKTEDDFRLIVAFIIWSLNPRGAYPILGLNGEQGSSKTTTAKILRHLIDPAKPLTRSMPRGERDMMVAAENNWLMSFDNVSDISTDMSDALCRIATGSGVGIRKLYTDKDEVIFDHARPIILNGITDFIERLDLADRSIVVTLPSIPEDMRKTEEEFWNEFEKEAPYIIGSLFDLLSLSLKRQKDFKPRYLPRMADFAKAIIPIEQELDWEEGGFLEAFKNNRQNSISDAMDNNTVAPIIIAMLQRYSPWTGTATELLEKLRHFTDDQRNLPKSPSKLSSELKRIAPALKGNNIEMTSSRRGKQGTKIIELRIIEADDADSTNFVKIMQ